MDLPTPGKLALAIRHVAFEDLGNLEPQLRAHGYGVEYREAGLQDLRPAAEAADLLIVLGGPIAVYDEAMYPFIRDELALIEERMRRERPMLGICLGAQLMARALGARVYAGPRKEIGWAPLALADRAAAHPVSHLAGIHVLHWHGDTFDLPEGAVRLASTGICANQAFACGRHALGLQFHAEVVERALERWYIGHACEIGAASGVSVPQLRAQASRHAPALQPAAAALWSGWLSSVA